jgi:hypothetical protein
MSYECFVLFIKAVVIGHLQASFLRFYVVVDLLDVALRCDDTVLTICHDLILLNFKHLNSILNCCDQAVVIEVCRKCLAPVQLVLYHLY